MTDVNSYLGWQKQGGALKWKSAFEAFLVASICVFEFRTFECCHSLYRIKNACMKHTLLLGCPPPTPSRWTLMSLTWWWILPGLPPLFLHTASDQKLGRGRGLGTKLHKMVSIRSYHIHILTLQTYKVWHLSMYHTLTLYPCRLLVGCAGCHRCGGSFRVYCDNASACNCIPQQKTNP